jgi:6-phosphogluconolactonase
MMAEFLFFAGTLNRDVPLAQRGPGLVALAFDEATLDVVKLAEAAGAENPSFLAVSADGSRVYANADVEAWPEGTVSAYAFDRSARAFTYINKQPTLGNSPVHNAITRDGSKLLVANYAGLTSGGPDQALAVFGIREDGGLTPPLGSAKQSGTGPDPERQQRSHPHSVTETGAGNVAIVADLGTDRLISYRIAPDGRLTLLCEFAAKPGAGPRHLALHPSGRLVFVANELDSTVVALSLDAATGRLSVVDIEPGAPQGDYPRNYPGDILVAPDGRFLYMSNRGHESIAVFAVDGDNGKLSLVEHVPCGGSWPRNLALTPSGGHLFSANQRAGLITILARDAASGRLTHSGKSISIGTPMCVRFV